MFSSVYKTISSDLEKGDATNAEKGVNWFAASVKEEPKKIYGDLLCTASSQGDEEVAKFCYKRGADLNHHMYSDKTPLGCAEYFKHDGMASSLKKWGATDDSYEIWSKPNSNLSECSCSSQKEQDKDKKKEGCILM